MESLRFVLPQSEIPTHWYNVVADMPNAPLPPLGPDGNPATPEQMSAIFPMAILEQEMHGQLLALWKNGQPKALRPRVAPMKPASGAD